MLIPTIAVTIQSPDCNVLTITDITCDYNADTCLCGYGGDVSPADPNIERSDIVRTVFTLTDPSGVRYVIDTGYLPTDSTGATITCADLAVTAIPSGTVLVQNSCGCSSSVSQSVSSACFKDGCWQIKYDLYTNQPKVTYDFSFSPDTLFPIFIATIIYNGSPVTINKACANITEIAAALNTASTNIGTFVVDDDTVYAFVANSSLYGDITIGDEYVYSDIALPNTLVSFTVNSVPYSVNTPVSVLGDIATAINSFNIGTAYVTDQNTIRILSSSVFGVITMDTGGDISPDITTMDDVEVETSVAAAIYTSITAQEFISCTIKNDIKNLKLRSFSANCNSCKDIQYSICELDSDYETMRIVASGSAGNCSCGCASGWYDSLRKKVNAIINKCF